MRTLAVIAGGGDLPLQVVRSCQRQGRPVVVLALEGFARPEVVEGVPHCWMRLGAAGKGFAFLHDHQVQDVVMIGPVLRPGLAALRPDWRAARFFARVGLRALGDDGLLRAVIHEVEREGFRVVGVEDVLGTEVLAPAGVLGRHRPDEQALADVQYGAQIAAALGALDVGQGCVVQQGLVLAVEAIEGTDRMLSRCADLRREGVGGVLVKLRKPQQEQRADLPTVGVTTVERAADAGLRGIALSAGGALIVDRPATVARADALGLFLYGIPPVS